MAIDFEKLKKNAQAKDAATYKVATADFAKTKKLVTTPQLAGTKAKTGTLPTLSPITGNKTNFNDVLIKTASDNAKIKPGIQTSANTDMSNIKNTSAGVGIGFAPATMADKRTPLDPINSNPEASKKLAYVGGRFGTGVVKAAKGLVNEIGYLGQSAAQGMYAKDAAESKVRDIQKSGDTYANVSSNLTKNVQESADKLSNQPLESYVDWGKNYDNQLNQFAMVGGFDKNKGIQIVGNVAEGVGEMVPAAVSNVILPGSGLYVMATGAAGNATEQALKGGANNGEALAYGVAIGVTEAATEKLFNGVAGIFGKGAADDVLKSVVKRVSQNETTQKAMITLANTLGEGFEEWLTEYAEAYQNKLIINQDSRDFKQISQDALYSGMIGSLTSIVMQSGNVLNLSAKDAGEAAANDTLANVETNSTQANTHPQAVQSPEIERIKQIITNAQKAQNVSTAQQVKPQIQANVTTPNTSLIPNLQQTKQTLPQGLGAASNGSQGGIGATKPTRFAVNDDMNVDLNNLPKMSNQVVIEPQKLSGGLKTKLSNMYTRTVDSLNPIVKFSKATSDNTAMLASNAVNAGGTVSHIIENSLVDMDGNKIGSSLKEITAKIPKDKQTDFWNYMMQRRNISKAVEDKNVIANYNSRMSAQAVKNIESKHPQWKKIGDEVVKWISDFNQAWGVNSGLIDQEMFNQMRLKDSDYVPAQREFSDVESRLTGGDVGRKFIDQNSPIKKMQGSERDINNPVENIMRLVNTTVKTARYNQVGQSLLNTLRKKPMPQYAEIVSEEVAKNSAGNNIVSVLENGKKYYIKINNPELLEALNGMPKSTYSVPILSNLTTGFKKITTQDNPLFGITNFARDLPTGYIYGSQWNPFTYLLGEGKAFGQIAKNGEMYQRYKAVGGGTSSFFSSADAETAALNLNKTENVFKKVGLAFNKFNSMIEEATRLNEFNAVFSKTGDVQKALNAANDVTVNFARGGDVIKTVDRNGVAYLNASVQGLDKLGKAFKPDKIAKTLLTGVVGITLPTLALFLVNRDNPYYEELSNRTKDAYFVIPNKFGELDENGTPMTFFKLPKSRELGMIFGSLAERIARAIDGEDEAFKGFGGTLATNIAPANPLDSGIVGPMINLKSNKDFAGRAIVPQSMEDRSPSLQYDEKTSELTKYIAEYAAKAGVELSPKQMDYLIDSWTGVVGDFLLPATTKGANALSPITNKFTADPRYSNQTIANFYENMDEAAKKANDRNFSEGLSSETVTLEEKISRNYSKASKEISNLSKISARAGVEKLTTEDVETLKGYGIDTSKKSQDIQKDIRAQQAEIAKAAIDRGTKADEMELDLNNDSDISKAVEKYQNAGVSKKKAYELYKDIAKLEPEQGESEVSTYQKIKVIGKQEFSEKQKTALVATLYTSSEKESMLPYLTTSSHLLSLYLTSKDSEMISMAIPLTITEKGVDYKLTDADKKLFKSKYANYFNSYATNVTSSDSIKRLRDKAYEAAKRAVINNR